MFAIIGVLLFFLIKFMVFAMMAMIWVVGATLYVMIVLPIRIIAGVLDRA